MFKNILLAFVIALAALSSVAQTPETPLVKIGDKTYSLEEFNTIYNKNNSLAQVPISREEYLQLFIRYKMKVQEAQRLGLDTLPDYHYELGEYRNELITIYINDTNAVKNVRAKIDERLKTEVSAEHILITVRPGATPDDTLKAYNLCNEAREKVVSGLRFDSIARIYSQDPSAKKNGGALGYFSALQMVEPFEDAAFSTPVGEISPVFRTNYGYHFLHVIDKRKWSGEMRLAHIMKVKKNANENPRAEIDSIYEKLKNGVDFQQLALGSDDQQTAQRGGDMGWIVVGQLIPQFANPCRKLLNNGDFTEPFETPFGWHIAKRFDFREVRDDATVLRMIERSHGRNWLKVYGRDAFIDQQIKNLHLKYNNDNVNALRDIFATVKTDSARAARIQALTGDLFTYDGGSLAANNNTQILRSWATKRNFDENLKALTHSEILMFYMDNIDSLNADFRYAFEEYKDGLLVFDITQRYVWSVKPDSATLKRAYDQNPKRYAEGGSFKGDIYFCKNAEDAAKIKALMPLNARKAKKAAKIAYKVVSGEQKQGGIYDDYLWPSKQRDNIVVNGQFVDGEPVPFEKVNGQLISDVQQIAEDEWIEQLSKKYPVTILYKL